MIKCVDTVSCLQLYVSISKFKKKCMLLIFLRNLFFLGSVFMELKILQNNFKIVEWSTGGDCND